MTPSLNTFFQSLLSLLFNKGNLNEIIHGVSDGYISDGYIQVLTITAMKDWMTYD